MQVRIEAEDGTVADAYDVRLPAPRGDMDAGAEKGEVAPADALEAALVRAWPEVWDVSEEDVARIFPRVVSHRLRVRDGPDDEILGSVMWPAVPVEGGARAGAEVADGVKLGWERKSVKEVLVRVLADV